MKTLVSVLFVLSFGIVTAQSVAPVNANATPEAKALLAYLHRIDDAFTLSGQHNYNQDMDRFTNAAREIAGKVPAVWGTDFIWNGTDDPGARIVEEAIRKHAEGYIVTLMWHAGRPMDDAPFGWRESVQAELTDAEWLELTTPGTNLHSRWLTQVDRVAGYLKQLQDAGVPVLWRPYHEMNGVWFWWGDKKGPAGYQALWKMMFDRYVHHHRLNNLIWVWNANAPRDLPKDEAFPYLHFYPGHEYVDVLATDVYNLDYEQKDYQELLDLAGNKVIALGEVGELPRIEFLEAQPRWAWFMVWSNFITTHNTPRRVEEVYGHKTVLTRDEVNLKDAPPPQTQP